MLSLSSHAVSTDYGMDREPPVQVSGVLACVTSGIWVAAYGWPLLASREQLRHVWHVVEFMGNTLIFTLSGNNPNPGEYLLL